MCAGTYTDTYTDMRADMCMDICADVCVDMSGYVALCGGVLVYSHVGLRCIVWRGVGACCDFDSRVPRLDGRRRFAVDDGALVDVVHVGPCLGRPAYHLEFGRRRHTGDEWQACRIRWAVDGRAAL